MHWTTAALALGGLLCAAPLRADIASAELANADVARLRAAGHTLKWNWTPPGRTQRFGHAETLVHGSVETVRGLVADFGNYKRLAPSITTSRVVGHGPDGSTDVYLRMGVLNNTIMLWNVTRFAPLRHAAEGEEVLEGQMVPGKGNIDDSAAVWTLVPVGPDWTVLKFDVLLRPSVPAPQSLVDEQLRDSAMDVVDSIHDRVESVQRAR
jgi:Polyketide cyclase / dehydrase and lipid transport